jgi:PIN domain nuclease of toxin-antitoxin system
MKHVVDTHPLLWYLANSPRLGPAAKSVLSDPASELVLPAIVLAEACWIVERGRVALAVDQLLQALDADPRIQVHPLDEAVVRRSLSEVFHYAGGPFNNTGENPRVAGRDPEGRTYHTFASFEDPDGNGWLLQEVKTRLPGREWKSTRARATDVATLAELLRETAEHHDHYEKTHAEHHWWDWYAPYLSARQNGSSPEEAAAAAGRHMEEALHVLPR